MIICGEFFYKGRFIDCAVEIEDGVIVDISKTKKGRRVRGIIMPAGIDVHVHFRDFKESYKETIETGSLSALYGGICLVVDQPNTNPPVIDEKVYFERMKRAEKTTYVDYSLNLGLVNDNADKIVEIVKKIEERYFLPAIGEVFLKGDMRVSYETLERVRRSTSKLITVHAEDPNEEDDVVAEVKAVERCLKMGVFHFCHISTARALDLIHESNSTSEVTPHHLIFSKHNTDFKVNPPLKSSEERVKLVKNFKKADVLASDHAPHTLEEKKEGKPGFPGVEVMYPIFFYLMKRGYVSINETIKKIAMNPAKIFGFSRYGEIEVGKYANFVVFDPKDEKFIKGEELHSKVGWTIYEGLKAVFPKEVYIRGVKVLEDGDVLVEKGFGEVL